MSTRTACFLPKKLYEWSRPVRRSEEGEPLPFIPNEIYERILDLVQPLDREGAEDPIAVLSKISLVCYFFYSVVVSRIFGVLSHKGNSRWRSHPRPAYPQFSREIVKGTLKGRARHLAGYVHTFRLVSWIDPDMGLPYDHANKFIKEALSAMPFMLHLTTVDLHYVSITPDILRALPSLQQVKTLKFTEFAVDELCLPMHYTNLKRLRLEVLHLTPSFDNQVNNIDDYAPLAPAFDYTSLATLVTHIPECVKIIQRSPHGLRLRVVKMKFDNLIVPINNTFFRMLPLLRQFSLGASSRGDSLKGVTLRASSVPHLEDIECPSSHLRLFACQGRPIRRVAIPHPAWGKSSETFNPVDLSPIAQLAASNVTLRIPLEMFDVSQAVHPSLLKVKDMELLFYKDKFHPIEDMDQMLLEDLGEVVRRMPQVETIRFAGHTFFPLLESSQTSLTYQYNTLSQLPSDGSTRLRVLYFGRIIWTRTADGDWDMTFEDELNEGLVAQAKGKPLWCTSAADIFGGHKPRKTVGVSGMAPILVNDHRGYLRSLLAPYIID